MGFRLNGIWAATGFKVNNLDDAISQPLEDFHRHQQAALVKQHTGTAVLVRPAFLIFLVRKNNRKDAVKL
jgi:hypothetical protein